MDVVFSWKVISVVLARVPEWGHIAVKGTKAYLCRRASPIPGDANGCYRLFVCLTDTLHNQQLIFPVNILWWGEVGVAIDTLGRQRFTGLVLPGRSPIYTVIKAVWMPAGMPIITW